jgi:hypothetical protein
MFLNNEVFLLHNLHKYFFLCFLTLVLIIHNLFFVSQQRDLQYHCTIHIYCTHHVLHFQTILYIVLHFPTLGLTILQSTDVRTYLLLQYISQLWGLLLYNLQYTHTLFYISQQWGLILYIQSRHTLFYSTLSKSVSVLTVPRVRIGPRQSLSVPERVATEVSTGRGLAT